MKHCFPLPKYIIKAGINVTLSSQFVFVHHIVVLVGDAVAAAAAATVLCAVSMKQYEQTSKHSQQTHIEQG